MTFGKSHLGRLLAAAVLFVGLGAIAYAATPAHRPGSGLAAKKGPSSGLAAKKDASKKDEPAISAPHAILIDAEYGAVLFEREADQMIFPASLAKLMTANTVSRSRRVPRTSDSGERTGAGGTLTSPPCLPR